MLHFMVPEENFESLYSSFIENGLFSGAVLGSVFDQKVHRGQGGRPSSRLGWSEREEEIFENFIKKIFRKISYLHAKMNDDD